jgi:hypothetical protein
MTRVDCKRKAMDVDDSSIDLVSDVKMTTDTNARFSDLDRILKRHSAFGNETGKLPCGEYWCVILVLFEVEYLQYLIT